MFQACCETKVSKKKENVQKQISAKNLEKLPLFLKKVHKFYNIYFLQILSKWIYHLCVEQQTIAFARDFEKKGKFTKRDWDEKGRKIAIFQNLHKSPLALELILDCGRREGKIRVWLDNLIILRFSCKLLKRLREPEYICIVKLLVNRKLWQWKSYNN